MNLPLELRSTSLTLLTVVWRTGTWTECLEALARKAPPGLFDHEPVVLDLSTIDRPVWAEVEATALQQQLGRHGLQVLGVRGLPPEEAAWAEAVGWPRLDDAAVGPAHGAAPEAPHTAPAPASHTPTEAVPEPRPKAEPSPSTLVVDRPLRSGQQVYARGGDLVVMAPVNAGAEVIADGHIHVYAPLRGRAIAGAKGDANARIFASQLEAELVAVAGVYRTLDQALPAELRGQPAQVRLNQDRLVIERIQA